MGCFDSIIMENPIKCKCGEELSNFQTKGLDCGLVSYVITKKGKFRENWKRYVDPKRNAKKYVYFEDIGFELHTSCRGCGRWHELYAIFLDGKLAKLKHESRKL